MTTQAKPAPRPTILIINHHYLPGWKTGGPVRSISNMVEWLGDDIDFKILTADRDRGDVQQYPNIQPGQWHTVGKSQVRYLSPEEFNLVVLRRIISETPHDVLYLNSVLADLVIRVLILRRLRLTPQRPTIVAPRGHLDAGALSLKARKKRLYLHAAKLAGLFRDVIWHASAETEREDIHREFGPRHAPHIHVIPNLLAPGLGQRPPKPIEKRPGHLRMVFLSRISRKKGLDLVLRALQGIVGTIEFDIYGPVEDLAYWDECQALMRVLPEGVCTLYKGVVHPDQVTSVLENYHLFVLPTLGENFGHVILEALSAGCPVLISDRTPWKDVEEKGAGWVVAAADCQLFRDAMRTALALDYDSLHTMMVRARDYENQQTSVPAQVETLKRLLWYHAPRREEGEYMG